MRARSQREGTAALAASSMLALLVVACDVELSPRSDGGPRREDAGPSDAGMGSVDAHRMDATFVDGGGTDAGPGGALLYAGDLRHSLITPEIAANLRAIAERDTSLEDARFIKVGDSITESPSFLYCFAGSNVDLDGRDLEGTRAWFRASPIGADTSFDRMSLSAVIGWSALAPLMGDPTFLEREHDAVRPRYATLMFGSNDVGFRSLETFGRDMWRLVEQMTARGTIPLLSTIPPRDDDPSAGARVPDFNLVVRALAQRWQLPLVDYHRELLALPDHGLGGDNLHPSVSPSGSCRLDAAGLAYGFTIRNLITLEQLDRARLTVDGAALDSDGPRLVGRGTPSAPYEIDSLPFAAHGDTRSGVSEIDLYSCEASDESGPEVYFRIELPAPSILAVGVVSMEGVDVDVHLVSETATGADCIARDDQRISEPLAAGTYYIVADTFVSASGGMPGEFLIYARAE